MSEAEANAKNGDVDVAECKEEEGIATDTATETEKGEEK